MVSQGALKSGALVFWCSWLPGLVLHTQSSYRRFSGTGMNLLQVKDGVALALLYLPLIPSFLPCCPSLSLFLSLSLCHFFPLALSLSLSVFFSFTLSVSVFLSLSLSLSLFSPVSLWLTTQKVSDN